MDFFDAKGAAYRDSIEMLLTRRDELIELRRRQAQGVFHAPEIYRRRVARSAAGAALIAGCIAMVVTTVPPLLTTARGANVVCLVASWPLAFIAYLVASFVASRRSASFDEDLSVTRDVRADVQRLEAMAPDHAARFAVDALEKWSVALPLAGLALMLPLTLHFLVSLLLAQDHFETWIALSVVLVSHAHLVVAVAAYLFARTLRHRSTSAIIESDEGYGWSVLGVTIAASAVPGAVFFLVPPILVAVTGVLFIPAMFSWIRRKVIEERRLVDIEEPLG